MSLSGTCPLSTRLCVLRRFVLAWLFVWGCSGQALAAAPVLMTIRAVDATDPAPYELRLRSELGSEGVDAIVANKNVPNGDARQLAAKFGVNAVVDVTVTASELTTVVWVTDPTLGLDVTRQLRVSNTQRDAVAVFALRSVDLLLGARLELEQQRRAKLAPGAGNAGAVVNGASASSAGESNAPASNATTSPAATPQPTDQRVRPEPAKVIDARAASRAAVQPPGERQRRARGGATSDRFGVGLALALMVPADKFGWATAPALAFTWHVQPRWALGWTVMGPFVNHINTSSGQYRITVDQELLQFELRRGWPLTSAFELEPALGLGGSRYAAEGRSSDSRYVGHLATAWSFYVIAGGSVVWHWGTHLHLAAGLSGFGRFQAPQILVDSRDLSGRARWNLLVKLGPTWTF